MANPITKFGVEGFALMVDVLDAVGFRLGGDPAQLDVNNVEWDDLLQIQSESDLHSKLQNELKDIQAATPNRPQPRKNRKHEVMVEEVTQDGYTVYVRSTITKELAKLAKLYLVPLLLWETPLYTGKLAASTNYIIGVEKLPGQVAETITMIVYQNARRAMYPYRHIVFRGRHPGPRMPPLQNMEDWVMYKFGYSRGDPHKLAYRIARSMVKRGTTPQMDVPQMMADMQGYVDEASLRIGVNLSIRLENPTPAEEGPVKLHVFKEFERSTSGRFTKPGQFYDEDGNPV